MKIEEDEMSDDLKNKINGEVTQTSPYRDGYAVDTIIAAQEITKDLGESNKKNKKLNMIKRPINTGVGKLKSSSPIVGEKEEAIESMGASSAGGFEGPLFSTTKQEMQEKCWSGYQQNGMKKKGNQMVPNCVKEGDEGDIKKVETKEATGSGSSGSYETPAAWAKSPSKKDWRGASKTQIPGGKFVQVKKKCKKFPYCNQGDIKSLKLYENDMVKQAIQNISEKHNISENVIKTIISYEYEKMLLNKK
jgi:hypothetical protein